MDRHESENISKIRRLTLDRETLRELTPSELRLAVGAIANGDTGHANRCHGTGRNNRC